MTTVQVVQILLYVFALVLLGLAAVNVGHPRIQFGWAGMVCWLLAAVFVPLLA